MQMHRIDVRQTRPLGMLCRICPIQMLRTTRALAESLRWTGRFKQPDGLLVAPRAVQLYWPGRSQPSVLNWNCFSPDKDASRFCSTQGIQVRATSEQRSTNQPIKHTNVAACLSSLSTYDVPARDHNQSCCFTMSNESSHALQNFKTPCLCNVV